MAAEIYTKKQLISLLFKHQDGIVISAIINELSKKGVFELIEQNDNISLEQLSSIDPCFNKGYLNVAIRSLASQGILSYTVTKDTIFIEKTSKYNSFKEFIHLYEKFSVLYKYHSIMLKKPISNPININKSILSLAKEYKILKGVYANNPYFKNEISVHIEGLIIIPILTYLNFRSDSLGYENTISYLDDTDINSLLETLDLKDNNSLTQKGEFLMSKSYAYGVTVSYFPIMNNISDYLYGDFKPYFQYDKKGKEKHVIRALNVWGSGGAHATYFKKFDDIIIDIFNKPIDEQPKGIIDVGCGNGALLTHIFNLIWSKTKRREDLHHNKLILIGADYNKEALLSTKQNFKKANIHAEVIWGDIGNPKEIDKLLNDNYQISLKDLLNVRSFLDHNRPFNAPKKEIDSSIIATGAFAYRGKHINNANVEQSLVEHLEKWKPYIDKYGLLMIELHTVRPNIVSMNLGKTPCTAYDVTHGFSDQYIVGIHTFNRAIKKAGLKIDNKHNYVFPNTETPTISINLIQ